MTVLDDDAFDALVRELYAVVPGEFTATRAARAKGADAADRARIGGVRKPTVSAWAVDLLAREAELADAFALGAALQRAQADLDAAELARLGRERRRLVAALGERAVAAAADHDVAVSRAARDEIEATINAALVDPVAAAAVRSARLARALRADGTDELADAVSGSVPLQTEPEARDDELAERRARRDAERTAREAQQAADRAVKEVERAEDERHRAQERADRAHDRVAALRAELDRAEADASRADEELDEATAAWRRSSERARAARAAAVASPMDSPERP